MICCCQDPVMMRCSISRCSVEALVAAVLLLRVMSSAASAPVLPARRLCRAGLSYAPKTLPFRLSASPCPVLIVPSAPLLPARRSPGPAHRK
jgi:hypothetical protein